MKVKSLGFNVNNFKSKFNSFSKSIGSPFNIENIEIEKGEKQNTATIMLTDLIAINLFMNKENIVNEIIVIAQGDKSQKSGYDIMLAIGSIISITSPQLNESGRAEVLKSLGLNKGIPKKAVHTVDNIRYDLVYNHNVAIVFTASHKDNLQDTH